MYYTRNEGAVIFVFPQGDVAVSWKQLTLSKYFDTITSPDSPYYKQLVNQLFVEILTFMEDSSLRAQKIHQAVVLSDIMPYYWVGLLYAVPFDKKEDFLRELSNLEVFAY